MSAHGCRRQEGGRCALRGQATVPASWFTSLGWSYAADSLLCPSLPGHSCLVGNLQSRQDLSSRRLFPPSPQSALFVLDKLLSMQLTRLRGRCPLAPWAALSAVGLSGCSQSSPSHKASRKLQFCTCIPKTTVPQGPSLMSPLPFPLHSFLGVCSSPCHLGECSSSWQGWLHVALGKPLP